MMKRIVVLVIALVLATAAHAGPLEDSKKAYEDALVTYHAAARVAYQSWSNYYAYVRAYYAVWNTWSRYQYYLRTESNRSFCGTVVERGIRMPVQGATVQLWTYVPPYSRMATRLVATTTTTEGGHFRIDGVATGRYTYAVSKPGYATARADVEITSTGGGAHVSLERRAALSGTVLWNNRALAGVKVSLYRTDVVYIRAPDANAIVTTDSSGRWTIGSADYATYRLIFEKANYRTETRDLTRSTEPVDLTVPMTYTGPAINNEASFDGLNRQ